MIILVSYLSIFLAIGIYDYFRIKNFDDFVVAGRRQKHQLVTLSMLATMIGASATMGIASLAAGSGIAAFLWLGSGSLGLILQSRFLSEKIRNLNVYTLPGLAEEAGGKEGKYIIAFVIVVSWLGIIAAQFTALSGIAAILTGKDASSTLIIICSSAIIVYTASGGQFLIMKTDALQLALLAAGLGTAFYAVSSSAHFDIAAVLTHKTGSGSSMGLAKILHLLFVVGGAYFVGPDIFSRNFTADSAGAAKKATFRAGVLLLLFSLVITLTGIMTGLRAPETELNPYIYIIKNLTGTAGGFIISAGLLSAIISSTDTCIMTASAIIEKDLIGRENTAMTRILALIVGFTALGIALFKKDIITLLLATYSVFSPGIVFPVFTAVYFRGKREIDKTAWLAAVITGSTAGIYSAVSGNETAALAGMAAAAVISLYSARRKIRN